MLFSLHCVLQIGCESVKANRNGEGYNLIGYVLLVRGNEAERQQHVSMWTREPGSVIDLQNYC